MTGKHTPDPVFSSGAGLYTKERVAMEMDEYVPECAEHQLFSVLIVEHQKVSFSIKVPSGLYIMN